MKNLTEVTIPPTKGEVVIFLESLVHKRFSEKELDIVENRDSDSELKIEEKTSEKKVRNPLKGGIKI